MDPYLLLLYIGIALLVGFIFGKLAERVRVPEITGYILAGLLIGPNVLGFIDHGALDGLHVLTNVVLAIIAYQIGTELWLPKLKKSGLKTVIITIVHALFTALVVFFGVMLFTNQLWLALALSAMAVASSPAPIMVIIRKLRAKGIVTETVIPIVGMIDIIAVILFGLLSSVSLSYLRGDTINVENALINPMVEVVLSILVGLAFGLILGFASKFFIQKFPKKDQYIAYLAFSVSLIMASVYIANAYHLSMILIPLVLGMTFTNFIGKETFEIQTAALNNFGGPFIILFFTIAGLELSLDILRQAGLLAVVFIALRMFGKIVGTYIGAKITKSDIKIRKFAGLCLLPQGGVTIGMLVAITAILPQAEAQIIQAVILASILFFEVLGPIFFEKTIKKAGECRVETQTVSSKIAQSS